jgi:spore coat polysaccharide biosynthesis protein SpsF (cytidylyltransferase family)
MLRIDLPHIVCIVQARMGSKRFPDKMMADLFGTPVLGWVLKRLKRAKLIKQIVVASPDKELVDYAYTQECWGFQDLGDPNNVLARYIKCSNWCNAEIVVRICGDSPLICPEIVDETIKGYLENRVDICTTVLRRTFARGMDVEVLHNATLKRMNHLTNDIRLREHVTLMAYENPALFKFYGIYDSEDLSWLNVSVDTPADLDRIRGFVAQRKGDDFNYSDIKEHFRRE